MKIKIAVITTKLLRKYIEPAADTLKARCDMDYFEYDDFSQVAEIYEKVSGNYDGVCGAGIMVHEIISRFRGDEKKPLFWVGSRLEEYYKEFFLLKNENPKLDFSRVMLDAALLASANRPQTVMELFGSQEEIDFEEQRRFLVKNISTDQMMHAVEIITKTAEQLWREGKIDMVVCRLSSVASELKRRGIPCTFVKPWQQNIQRSLLDFVRELELSRLDRGLQSVIFITADSMKNGNDNNKELDRLEQCLIQFDRERTVGFLIQKTLGGIELYTSKQAVDRLTDHFTFCPLNRYIEQQTGLKTYIGYGIGLDIIQAREHALRACKGTDGNGQGALMDENGVLVRLVSCESGLKELVDTTDLIHAAKTAGLSVPTIQKVISAMEILGTSRVTTQELASVLKVSVVNANRVLNSLEASGQAEVISVQKAISQGRPSRVYEITLKKNARS